MFYKKVVLTFFIDFTGRSSCGVSNNEKAKYVVLAFTLVMVSKQFMEIKTKNGNIEANSSLIVENSQFKIYINF